MPPLERTDLCDRAVLWTRTGEDKHGQSTLAAPVELKVRWVGSTAEQLAKETKTVKIDATVVVDQAIALGSAMWFGRILDLPGTAHTPEVDVMYVFKYTETRDIKGRNTRRTVQLVRSRDALDPRA